MCREASAQAEASQRLQMVAMRTTDTESSVLQHGCCGPRLGEMKKKDDDLRRIRRGRTTLESGAGTRKWRSPRPGPTAVSAEEPALPGDRSPINREKHTWVGLSAPGQFPSSRRASRTEARAQPLYYCDLPIAIALPSALQVAYTWAPRHRQNMYMCLSPNT